MSNTPVPIPDYTTWSETDQIAHINALNAAYTAKQQAAEAEKRNIRGSLPAILNQLDAEIARVQAVIDTPNADINAKPAPSIIANSRAIKRSLGAVKDALRLLDQ